MRYALLTCLLIVFGFQFAVGQTQIRTIEVEGVAERLIEPDEVYISIRIVPYKESGSPIVTTEEQEAVLTKAVLLAGLDSSALQLDNYYSNRFIYKRQKKLVQDIIHRDYILKVSKLEQLETVLDKLDPRSILNVSLHHLWHSRYKEIIEELDAQAISNARRKANSLLKGDSLMAGKLTSATSLPEPKTEIKANSFFRVRGVSSLGVSDPYTVNEFDVDVKKIPIRSVVITTFEIIDKP